MPESEKYLLELLRALVDGNVKFIVCGGVAAVLHGVERLTLDLDISLSMKPGNLRLFLKTMKDANMVPRAPLPPETILDKKLLEKISREKGAIVFTFIDNDKPFKQIDVFITEALSFDKLNGDSCAVELEKGYEINILSAKKLLEMKLQIKPPREKDVSDIKALKKIIGRRK
jgi:hypothetical protein